MKRRGPASLLLAVGVFYGLSIMLPDLQYRPSWLHLVAVCNASLVFALLTAVARKSCTAAIAPALRVLVVLSAVPYVSSILGVPVFGDPWLLPRMHKAVLLVILVSPEAVAFVALLLPRGPLRIIGYVGGVLAVLLAVEILPIRMAFIWDVGFEMMNTPTATHFGDIDREAEFKRALLAMDHLLSKSRNTRTDALGRVVVSRPDLVRSPEALRLDTCLPPWHQGSDTYWREIEEVFQEREYVLDVDLDTDGDGLTDWQEIELLSDASNEDTDGDGFDDAEDTDPLNPLVRSDYADINAEVLSHLTRDCSREVVYLIDNEFENGHGEFANCGKHIVILHPEQVSKWTIMFGAQYSEYHQRSLFGQRLSFVKLMLSQGHQFAVVGVVLFHGVWADSSGGLFLLLKWQGKWRIIAERCIWY